MGLRTAPRDAQRRVNALLLAQHAVSREQLLALGLSSEAIRGRLESGRLIPLSRGVYAAGGSPPTRERRWAAAVLASGPTAALSHLSSLALWQLRDVDPAVIHVSLASRSRRARSGIRTHRPRCLPDDEITVHRGVRTTTVARTLIDCAALLGSRSMERMLDEAQYLELFDSKDLGGCLERQPRRPGASRLRAVLAAHEPGSTRTISTLEEDFLLLVRRVGISGFKVNEPLGPYTIDFMWQRERVAVETDGRHAHERAVARERDYRRDAWLHAHGWQPLRFTWHQVNDRPHEVLAVLGAVLPTRA